MASILFWLENKKRPLERILQRALKHTDLWNFVPKVCVYQITWCGPDGFRTRDLGLDRAAC